MARAAQLYSGDMNALHALLLVSTLVLRSGDRIPLDEPARTENGRVIFRSAGQLYSLAAHEVATTISLSPLGGERAGVGGATFQESAQGGTAATEDVRRFRVTDEERRRRLAELEQNHAGTAMPVPPSLVQAPPPVDTTAEEWEWRRQARVHEEAVLRAKEELALLEEEIERLRREIHFFVSQGFKPHQFTWQTTRLGYATQAVPRAELELRRVERAYAQFREDARRQGVMPGWLR